MEVRGEPGNYVGDLSFMFLVLYLDGSLNQLTQQTLSVVLAVEQWNMMAGWPSSECLCNIYIYIYMCMQFTKLCINANANCKCWLM